MSENLPKQMALVADRLDAMEKYVFAGTVRKAMVENAELRQHLTTAQAEIEALRGRVAQLHNAAHELYSWCVENLTAEQISAGLTSGQKIGQLLKFERPATEAFIAGKQAEAVEAFGARVAEGQADDGDFWDGDYAAGDVQTMADREGQRLRQQADEAETAGGGK